MASQDSWARPLAKTLVDLFRVDDISYFRVTNGGYDFATGDVTSTETEFKKAAAVTETGSTGQNVAGKEYYLECWINTEYVDDIKPTTDDFLTYNGRRWNISEVMPAYSGDTEYAVKVRALS